MKTGSLASNLIWIFLLFPSMVTSQSTPIAPLLNYEEVIPSSPTAFAFSKYVDQPVNLYTGIPEINIPLYSIVRGGVELPIEMQYHGGGFEVGQIAPYTGLGWSLMAGGNVTRTMRGGLEDEHNGSADIGCNPLLLSTMVQKGYWNNSATPVSYIPIIPSVYDTEPDMFYYSTPGNNGRFVGNKDLDFLQIPFKNISVEIDLQPYNRSTDFVEECFIEGVGPYPVTHVYYQTGETIAGFEIKEPDGKKYIFGEPEWTQTYSVSCPGLIPNTLSQQVLNSRKYPSTWHLKEIRDENDNILFTFEYESISEITYDLDTRSTYYNLSGDCNCEEHSSAGDCITGIKVEEVKRLSKISFLGGYITFDNSFARADLLNDKALASIKLYNEFNELQNGYRFEYSYFPSTGTGSQFDRLRLDKVVQFDNQSIDVSDGFELEYSTIPFPSRLSHEQDFWGYFNGNGASSLKPTVYIYPAYGKETYSVYPKSSYSGNEYIITGENRNVSSVNSQAGTLQRIYYPTGGYTNFVWEPNEFRLEGQNRLGPGLRIKQTEIVESIGSLPLVTDYDYTLHSSPSVSSGYVTDLPQFAFKCNSDLSPQGWQDGTIIFSSTILNLTKSQGSYVNYSEVKETKLGNGYTLYKFTSPADYADVDPVFSLIESIQDPSNYACSNLSQTIGVYDNYPFSQASSKSYLRGFLKEELTFDEGDNLLKSHSAEYTIYPVDELSIKSGKYFYVDRTYNPGLNFLAARHQYSLYSEFIRPTRSIEKFYSGSSFTEHVSENDFDPVYGNQIESRRIGNNGMGYVEKIYFPGNYYSSFVSNGIGTFFSKTWTNGNEIGNYSTSNPTLASSTIGQNCFGKIIGKINVDSYNVTNLQGGELKNLLRIYLNGSLIKEEEYIGLGEHEVQTDVIQFYSGDVITLEARGFEVSYTPIGGQPDPSVNLTINSSSLVSQVFSPLVKSLRDMHLYNLPLETHYLYLDGQQQKMYLSEHNQISDFGVGELRVSDVFRRYYDNPTDEEMMISLEPISGSLMFSFDEDAERVASITKYNSLGNIEELNAENHISVTNIWNRNNLLVSQIVNSTQGQVAYTSFESLGSLSADENGNWSLSVNQVTGGFSSSSSRSGSTSYDLNSSRPCEATVENGMKYTLSFWTKNSESSYVITVNGQSGLSSHRLSNLGPNGWTYVEYELDLSGQTAATSTVRIVGNTGFNYTDELRLFPADGRMTTFCYDRNLNLSSICDENSNPQSFEYDDLNRLIKSYDLGDNLIQIFDYKFINN